MSAKTLREQRAKLVADARAIADGVKDGATMSAEDSAKFDTIMAEADNLKAEIDRIERLEASEDHLGQRQDRRAGREPMSEDEIKARAEIETRAFNHYLRNGLNGMSEELRAVAIPRFQAAQGTGSDSAGGYTVPEGFYGQMESAMLAFGGMLEVAFTFNTASGNELPIPTDNDTSNSGAIIGENPTSASEQDVTFGAVRLGAHTYTSKMIRVSNQLLQDSAFDLNSFLADKLATRLARIQNLHFTTGDGASKPWGALSMAASSGITAAATDVSMDNMIELHHSVDPAYRSNSRFMFNDATLLVLKKKKDGQGRWLWQSGIAVREPDTIDGRPYTINQQMPSIASGVKSILFGDFSKYYIRRVAGTMVLRLTERYAELNQTAFVSFQRCDGALVDAGTNPLKYLIHA